MSVILAVETSSDYCSVALLRGEEIFDLTELAPREHTRKLLPMIDQILAENKLTLTQLDAIAYGAGPGSFTGLRICLGIVQGLAYGADLPVIPVSSLQTIAETYANQHRVTDGQKLLVANDARMDEVYWCLYEIQGNAPVPLTPEAVDKPEVLWEHPELRHLAEGAFVALGDGWNYPEMAEAAKNTEVQVVKALAPQMLPIAKRSLEAGELLSAEQAQPSYLRDSVAWKKRERIRNK